MRQNLKPQFMTTIIIIFIIAVLVFLAVKKLSGSSTPLKTQSELSSDGNRLTVGTVVFEYLPESAMIKVTEGTNHVFHDYPHRLYLKPNFSTKDTIYQETFTGRDNWGNVIHGYGGVKSGKAIAAKWFELHLTQRQGAEIVQQDLHCWIDRSEGLERQISSFVLSRRELGREKAKSLGQPMYAIVDFSDTFDGFD